MPEYAGNSTMDPGFGNELDFGDKPALIIVDFVKAYLEPESPLYAGVEQTCENCSELLAAARRAGIPIFHSNVSYEPGTEDGGVFKKKLPLLSVFDRGSPLADFADILQPNGDEKIITKQYASAFFATPLSESLLAAGIDTLIIAGVTTSGCIRATAVDAIQHGFIPVVVRDSVGDRDAGPHEANLYDLQAKYANVVSQATVLEYLEKISQS